MKLLALPVRRPLLVLLLLAAASGLAATRLGRLVIDNSTENILPESNPRVRDQQLLRELFGSEELIVIGFEVPEGERVVDPRWFAVVERLTQRLQQIPELGPEQVIGLANIKVPALVASGGPVPGVTLVPLAPRPVDRAGADRLARKIAQIPLLEGLLVSRDLRATTVFAKLTRNGAREEQDLQIRVVGRVGAITAELARESGAVFHLAGTPVTKSAFVSLLRRDMLVFVPACVALIGLILLVLFRSPRGVLLPLLVVLLASLWTMATIEACGKTINTMTALLPPLLMAVGIADVVHLLAHWAHCRATIDDPAEAVLEALRGTRAAILMTTLTTMSGFLSLLASPVGPIREFGLFAAIGAFYALVATLALAPAVLVLLPGRPAASGVRPAAERLGRLARRVGELVLARPRVVLAVNAVLALAFVLAAVRWLEVEVNFIHYFKADHPLSHAVEFFDRRMSGTAPIELLVEGPPGSFRQLDALRKLARFQQELAALRITDRRGRTIDPIDTSVSVADFALAANGLLTGCFELPPTPAALASFQLFGPLAHGGKGLDPLLRRDAGMARISARVKAIGSRDCATLVRQIEARFAKVFGTDGPYRLRVTGAAVIFMEVADAITWSQLRSFSLALALVFLAMLVLLRSPRLALLSLVPNLFPIAVAFGVMALAGIELNSSTAMVACIAIGIAVDDTIHMLASYRRRLPLDGPREAVLETCRTVGAACGATTLILCAGFGVSALASFYPTIHFGVISALTIAVALYADFVVLPALLAIFGGRSHC